MAEPVWKLDAEKSEQLDRSAENAADQTISVAAGDGIGPEITAATLQVLDAAHVPLRFQPIEMGLQCWQQGLTSGVPGASWDAIRDSGVLLKGPMTTPQGSGMKSLNVTLRKSLGLFANVRPVRAYVPYVPSHHPDVDLVIIRENEEDLYAGIEHRQTQDVVQCLKLVSRPGCERIIRYAFEYVMTRQRKRLTCMTKDNIMKLTDGLFHEVFDDVAREYPDVEADHMIVDIGMARVANEPESFDVIVTPNLYGDIVSDIAAEVTGSVGLAPSANIGETISVFEAIHGSAPDIAGENIANPSGLLLSAVKMLAHLGQGDKAELIHDAWLRTIEDGIHTQDIYSPHHSKACVGTEAFANAVIRRLGSQAQELGRAYYPRRRLAVTPRATATEHKRELVGVDVFVQSRTAAETLAGRLQVVDSPLALHMITNRGVQVWPQGAPETYCTDHWRCRFKLAENKMPNATSASARPAAGVLSNREIFALLTQLDEAGVDIVKTEHLYNFDGQPGYSLGQGQ
ncbi:MAG: NADP-dependent isocitrate dehydrogenase [Pseudomonadota bacterium]